MYLFNLNFILLLMYLFIFLTKKITLNIFKIKIYHDVKTILRKYYYAILIFCMWLNKILIKIINPCKKNQ